MTDFELLRDFYARLDDIISDPDFPMIQARQIRDCYNDFLREKFFNGELS